MIGALAYPLLEMQKAYGRKFDIALVLKGWEMLLADKYNGEQICYALKEYALNHGNDFPAPKDLIDILNPQEPLVSDAEFVAAQKKHEREGFPEFSASKTTIDKYHAQHKEQREDFKVKNKKLLDIAGGAVKKIETSERN